METFQQIVNGYLQSLAGKQSWHNYRNLYAQHFEHWETHPTFQDLHRWHAQHRDTPHAANKAIAFLRASYTWAARFHNYHGPNPAIGVKAHPTFSRERSLTSLEVGTVLGAMEFMPIKLRVLLTILLLTGCRLSEALRMQAGHVNMATGQWNQHRTKNGKPHVTSLPTQARAALSTLLHRSPYYFEGMDGQHYSVAGAEKAWDLVRDDLGLADVRLHDFRRTLATHLYRATKDEYLVKRCINHYNRNVTAIYVRISHEEVASALQAQADRFMALTPTNGGLQGHLMTRHVSRPTHYERSLT